MENEFNYGNQPDNGYDPNSGVNLDKNEGYDPNANYNQNAGYDANAQQNAGFNAYGTADNSAYGSQPSFDSFGNPIQNNMGGFNAPNEGSAVLAIVSLVCGIVSIVICCCYGVGIIPGAAALITGIISKVKHKPKEGLALAGIITGAVGVLSNIVLLALMFLGLLSNY